MVFEFKFPDVGEGITEGKLIRWLIKENDSVKKDQAVAEVETDKAVVEIPSPITAKVSKLLYKEHEIVYVGKPMILFDDGTTNFSAPEQKLEKQKTQETQQSHAQHLPPAVTHYEQAVQKSVQQTVHQAIQQTNIPSQHKFQTMEQTEANSFSNSFDREILALPSVRHYAKENRIDLSKIHGTGRDGRIAMQDLNGTSNGKSNSASKRALNETLDGKSFIATILDNRQQSILNQKNIPSPQIIPNQQSQSFSASKDILATPSTRQLARDLNVDISIVVGTGDHGIITKDDVTRASSVNNNQPSSGINSVASQNNSQISILQTQQTQQPQQIQQTQWTSQQTVQQIAPSSEEYIPLTSMRNAISRKMSDSWSNAVHVTISDEADVTELVNIRERNKSAYEARGVKLTYLPFFVKSAVLSLQKNPKLNASLDTLNNRIIQKHYYNIGIATDTENGLMVPVVRNAESKSIIQIANEINDLALRARNRTIRIDEMIGGTFTITSVGNIVGQVFTQIINYPESAILGIGRIIEKPVVRNDQIVSRKIATLSVTVDHRIIDGADASRFLKTLIEYLENPQEMMLEMA